LNLAQKAAVQEQQALLSRAEQEADRISAEAQRNAQLDKERMLDQSRDKIKRAAEQIAERIVTDRAHR